MRQNPNALFNLFMQINATFSKDSSDCIATLSSAAECIQFLVLISAAYPSNPDKIPLSPSADGKIIFFMSWFLNASKAVFLFKHKLQIKNATENLFNN